MFKINMPDGARSIIERFKRNGYDAYIVGGCVRDSIRGVTPKDWDICTSALPFQILNCFQDKRVVETGLQHGTVTVIMDDEQYEVTTFRVDGEYTDNRHPDSVCFVDRLEEDLSRRDFTMNAMAYNDESGLVDVFGGQSDIRAGIITCVGDPDTRFKEDGLRILRALRFASAYNMMIDSATEESIHRNVHLLKNISAERINVELCKILTGSNALSILLNYSDIICTIIPELTPCVGFEQQNRYHIYPVYDHIAHAVDNYCGSDVVVKIALLLHDIGKPYCFTTDENGGHFYGHGKLSNQIAESILSRLRFDNRSKEDILELILYHDSSIAPTHRSVRRWLNKIGELQLRRLIEVSLADALAHAPCMQQAQINQCIQLVSILNEVIDDEQCFRVKDLDINGYEIMKLGVPQGKQVGIILNKLLNSVIDGDIQNDFQTLICEAQKIKEIIQ